MFFAKTVWDEDGQALTTSATKNSEIWLPLARKSTPTPPATSRRKLSPDRFLMKFDYGEADAFFKESTVHKKQEHWVSPMA